MNSRFFCIVCFCISVVLLCGASSEAAWFIEQLDTSVKTGAEMIQGQDGTIHISYVGNEGLTYAYHQDRSWHFEVLGILDSASDSPSIALDSHGNPHILAIDNVTDTCWYLRATEDVWISEKLAEVTGANINDCRIAIDADDTIHALYSLDFQPMKYGTCPDGGSWTWETPDPVNNSRGTDMALDSNGNPCISYYSNSDSLMMAFKDQEGWHRSVVDTPIGYTFQESAICIDNNDYVHITFRNHDLSALRYAWQDAGGSHKMTVTDLEDTSFSCDMDLNPDGFARIVFYDGEDSSIKYARHSSSGWTISTVDDDKDCGLMADLLISGTGHAHMAYRQLDDPRALLYATNKASQFPDITVQLSMSDTEIYQCSPFWLEATVINPSNDIASAPFVCVLDVLGQYFFYPSWSEYPPNFDYSDEALPGGTTRLMLIPEIEWPDGVGELSGIFFHAAVLTDDMSALRGNMASIEWGYYDF